MALDHRRHRSNLANDLRGNRGDDVSSFGPAFWIGFSLHVLVAELWLRAFPNPPELAHESHGSTRVHAGRLRENPPGKPKRLRGASR